MSGMVGAMLVSVLVIVAFVAFRAINRDDLELEREPIEYLPVVAAIQEAGFADAAYPPTLPAGWKAVGAKRLETGWAMDLYTGSGTYVGIRQEDRRASDMVDEYLGEDAEQGDDVTIPGELGPEWETFSEADGDRGLAVEVGELQLLVFGAIDADELKVFAGGLVTSPVESPSATSSPAS